MAEPREFQYTNFARSTLLSDLAAGATTLNIQPTDQHLFPNADATYDEIFACILFSPDESTIEIVYCTERVSGILTVERGKENTGDVAWPAGTKIIHTFTAQTATDIVDAVPPIIPIVFEEAILFMSSDQEDNGGRISLDTITWTKRQKPPYQTTGLLWIESQKRFVMCSNVSDDQKSIFISDDYTVTWQNRPTPASSSGWSAIAFAPTLGASGRLACSSRDAGTDGNKIMTSDDFGDTWIYRSTPAAMDGENWDGIHWDAVNGNFVVFGNGAGNVYLSTDGITWVQATSAGAFSRGFNMAQQDIAPFAMTYAYPGNFENEYSLDGGDNWIANPAPNGWPGGTLGMAWGGPLGSEVFVGSLSATRGQPWSPDGDTWTEGVNPLPLGWRVGTYGYVVWAPDLELFIAVSKGPATSPNGIITSADGKTWTGQDLGNTAAISFEKGAVYSVPVGAPRNREEIVMVENATTGVLAATSVDGYTWETSSKDITNQRNHAVAFAPALGTQGRFCTVGHAGNIEISDDAGLTWAVQTSPAAIVYEIIIWNPTLSLFVAGANAAGTTQIITSADGITWVARTTPSPSFLIHDIAQDASGNMVAVGTTPAAKAIISSDGITWTPESTNPANRFCCVVYDSFRSRFVSFDIGEAVHASTDLGATWSNLSASLLGDDISPEVCKAIYVVSDDRIVLSTDQGILTSEDGGVTWTRRLSDPGGAGLLQMSNGRILLCQSGGMSFSEDNGITWYEGSDPDDQIGTWRYMAAGRVLETV